MDVTIQVAQDLAKQLRQQSPAAAESRQLQQLLNELEVSLTPMHPGATEPLLIPFFKIAVPDLATAERIINRLQQVQFVEAAYLKPEDELPGGG